MTDELRQRLTRLDPMHSGVPTEPTTSESSRQLLEQVMSTPTTERQERNTPRRTRTIAVAAVAVMVLAVAGGIALLTDDNSPSIRDEAPLALEAAGEDMMASCIVFSAEELERVAEIAFAGTVTAVDGDSVTLSVDTWFRGGDTSEVVLNAPQGMEALIGGIPFQVGSQYLISAQGGSVNYCGFSGPDNPDLRSGFETAFAQG